MTAFKNSTLLERIDLQRYLIDCKQKYQDDVFNLLSQFENFDDPKVMKLIFDYNTSQNHAYEKVINEIRDEYKTGIIDPARIVGKIEMKKGRTRRKIENIKKLFGNNASNQVRPVKQ